MPRGNFFCCSLVSYFCVQREKSLRDFVAGKQLLLLATDVAARGLHVRQLHTVVRYTCVPSYMLLRVLS